MKIVCLIKFVPNIESFKYDYELNVLIRENANLILNPDDAACLAFALKIKKNDPNTNIEIVTMAPLSVMNNVRDILRVGVDKASIISDRMFVGSDTYATSKIIGKYIQGIEYDILLSGSHSLDGDTAHVPVQIAQILGLSQMSNIKKIDEISFSEFECNLEVDADGHTLEFQANFPALLSISKDSGYKMPFVAYKDLEKFVDDKIVIVSNDVLKFSNNEVGLMGSLTKVYRTNTKILNKKKSVVVNNDDEGIELVYQFLKDKGFV